MYKLLIPLGNTEASVVVRLEDNAFIPFDPANTDYQEYLKYIEQGGLVLPADTKAEEVQQ